MIKRPMKGQQLEDLSKVQFPVYASPKIDGFRCVLGEYPLTSRLSRFPNEHFHQSLSGILPHLHLLDSEVVVGHRRGPGVLQSTSSGLTSRAGRPSFTLWVFDAVSERLLTSGFEDRHAAAARIVADLNRPDIRILRHRLIDNLSDLEEYLTEKLELGFEGIMIRSVDGPYKQGKATVREGHLLKIKPFEDAEGRITGWFEEQENTNEAKREATGKLKRSSAKEGKVGKARLGGFTLVDCKTGVDVRVGGGFTKEQRIRLWPIREQLRGELVTYKKQTMGEKDKPRHPGFVDFVHFRPEWDFAG